jgi:shikimate kinase
MIKNLPDRIFLCGFMGAGKSTIGKRLAERLDVSFLDLDDYIEKEAGKEIPKIFEKEGETEFRRLERQSLLKLIRNYQGVIALGGGSLQNQHIVDHIKLNGLLIFIETPFSVILERITGQKNRPLLLNEQGNVKDKEILKEELKTLYEQRLSYYRQAELSIVNDEKQEPKNMVDSLIKKIEYHVSHY